MKKLFIEIAVILTVATIASVIFNQFTSGELRFLDKYPKSNPENRKTNFEILDIELFNYYRNESGVIVLDARSKEEYENGHIPGAFYFGINEFEKIFNERGKLLHLGKMIITYCSEEQCNDSYNLAVKLSEKGIGEIFIFKGGIRLWEESGYSVKRSMPEGGNF